MIWSAEEQGADFDVLLAEGKMFAASYQVGAAGSCSPESAFMPQALRGFVRGAAGRRP